MSLSAVNVKLAVRRQLRMREVKVSGLTSCLLVWLTCDRQENLALMSSWKGCWLVADHDIESCGVQRGCLNPSLIMGLLRRSHKDELLLTQPSASLP